MVTSERSSYLHRLTPNTSKGRLSIGDQSVSPRSLIMQNRNLCSRVSTKSWTTSIFRGRGILTLRSWETTLMQRNRRRRRALTIRTSTSKQSTRSRVIQSHHHLLPEMKTVIRRNSLDWDTARPRKTTSCMLWTLFIVARALVTFQTTSSSSTPRQVRRSRLSPRRTCWDLRDSERRSEMNHSPLTSAKAS